jgi:histidyl-tRNA synthetase
MFRHERPQKGRYRQFHQFGVEALGFAGPDIDAEQILMCARLWKKLGLRDVTLQLNTLGDAAARQRHRTKLVAYFAQQSATHTGQQKSGDAGFDCCRTRSDG